VTRLLAIAFVAGCMVPPASEKEILRDDVRDFHEAVRWQRFGDAAVRVATEQRARFLDRLARLRGDAELSDYEITNVQPEAPDRVAVGVRLEWQSKQTGLLRATSVLERWRREHRQWFLYTSRVVDGEALPWADLEIGEK
jgi:hypothetical protein